ncbi:dTDP-4-dehydrorhamnose 3,5-epimerase [Helicobacter sp. 16-1353]|uniref:dTDP-4-dehydrorhamnose 3,5-epimerase n=1 Tax=Helicobacter sp. 16-1353 TaxID=2004996 RepID=UPI000DCF0281|nr:dTDP-4-dehydrorhamnose 3,5-epimerase [Helicobacter sp. 16-1353]RAX53989.1 dTDP-4-dehydrorhamnose 3,5-epimerase [Helicobacter sp. 16-1353]
MGRFTFLKTPLENLNIIIPKQIKDTRGYFERYFCSDDFREIGLNKPICQINHSFTKQKGSLRGMHFQLPPHSEIKIIRTLKGEIYDVAIDLRADSPTFLQYFGTILSKRNNRYLYIPEGFAHGFQTLSNDVEVLYLVSESYNQNAEAIINPLDSMINIKWKLEISDISTKDKNAPFLKNAELLENLKKSLWGGGLD